MLRKTEVYTNITPIPSHIPRQLALDILHSHSEIITLNPLVIEHNPIKAPRDADATEYYSTWYEIIERIQYVPGMGKIGSGKISFKGCFHDMPWGLQTHIYAPMNVDLRNKWQIAGNQPGEPPQPREMGIDAPAEGLYLREDIEIRCNLTLVSFVKNQLKASSKVLVDRLIKKAELLGAGELLAMMENGRLKTINPADRSSTLLHQPLRSPPASPGLPYKVPLPPSPDPATTVTPRIELPGDYYHPQPSPSFPSPRAPPSEFSAAPSPEVDKGRWSDYQSSADSRPTSYAASRPASYAASRPTSYAASDASGLRSPLPDQKNFTAGLIPVGETREEHDGCAGVGHSSSVKAVEMGLMPNAAERPPSAAYKYNPQDFARV